ncbi:hypothetical protein F7725_007896 [Dissostichus mawsoni]|uniref:Uncharacterized protein n=1 Tax=Dissostichus mawsoni TaxID=36200 RepID=A0A7J5Y6J5_DISMA|nr:hypothetical protein F7725_007896 [Dissostichus mawsoni]
MRDELGSCAPGSFTAVALFYIYGAAAGPAVARPSSLHCLQDAVGGCNISNLQVVFSRKEEIQDKTKITVVVLRPLKTDHERVQHYPASPSCYVVY